MNLKEAYSILEIPATSTPEEAKKKYRELTKKWHPDINKESGAEEKFKKINEAYQVVSSGKGSDREDRVSQHVYNPFGQQIVYEAENISLSATVSFAESVLGCKKEIKFNRKTKCKDCNGQGEFAINNGCDKCGGKGQITNRNANMIFVQTCDKCFGKVEIKSCSTCNGEGAVQSEVSMSVSVPGGVQDDNILRLGGVGNFVGSWGPIDQHTDVHLRIRVISEPGLRLEGNNVVSDLSISLLEALTGCKKTVKTIVGDKSVDIVPKSRNKDEIIISHLGVNRVGNHMVILDIQYPEDVSNLVNILTNKDN
jgi:molecular chaperone DnaJ